MPLRTLHEAGLAENAGTYSRFEAVVIAKTEDAYQLPVQMQLRCTRAFGDECNRCGLRERYAAERGTPSPVEQNIYSPIFLEQIGMPRKALDLHVRAACQIPAKCPELERDDLTSVKVWELRLTDMLRASDVEGKPTEVAAIVIGHDLRPNAKYLFTARSVSSPKDQTHTQVVYQARETEVVGAVDPKAEAAAAKVVRRKGKTSLKSWVDKLLEEAAGVTGVRERPDVHLATLLCYATPVWIADERYPNDAHRRGWGDVLIMGDTNQAKSHTVEHLQRYLGLGTLIAAKKTTTRAGVYGGMESFKGRMYVSWGIIPRLDRQLVVFDEAHGLPRDIRTALTAVRSSGRAEINMVGSQGTQMTWARTRKIWLPNLEDGRSMADYPVGVDAAAEFWTTPEDLRRTDVAVFVSRNESDPHGERRAPAWWTPEVARTTIMRAWGQLLVTVPGALVERARQLAAELSGAYSSRSTLLELNDLDGKILRLGVALANLGMVEVDDAHLAFIAEWIDHVYSTQAAGWKQISPFEKKREDMDERTAELLWGALDQMVVDVPYFCTVFSETSLLSQADFEDVAKPGWDWREVRKVLRLHGAIVPTKGNRWSATRGFVKVMLARLGGGKGR